MLQLSRSFGIYLMEGGSEGLQKTCTFALISTTTKIPQVTEATLLSVCGLWAPERKLDLHLEVQSPIESTFRMALFQVKISRKYISKVFEGDCCDGY
jgi:hypothetical protein